MLTDAELLELEMLLIQRYRDYNFEQLLYDKENKLILIKDEYLKKIIVMYFNERHQEFGDDIAISVEIFKILQSRYFRNNETIKNIT